MFSGEEDIIDETLNYFRANVLFRFFEFNSLSDRTLVYLTAFTQLCLVKLEKIEDKPAALRQLKLLAIGSFLVPGDAGFVLGGYFPQPGSRNEADSFRAYFKQAREELTVRLVERVFNADGQKSKWWQQYSKRKFMGMEMKE